MLDVLTWRRPWTDPHVKGATEAPPGGPWGPTTTREASQAESRANAKDLRRRHDEKASNEQGSTVAD